MTAVVPARELVGYEMGTSSIQSSPLYGLGPLRVAGRGVGFAYVAARTALRVKPKASDRRVRLEEGATYLQKVTRRLLVLHGVQLEVRGPVPDPPALLVANHISYLDPLLITSACKCLPIAKAEIAGWPLVGAAMKSLGVLFVDRRRKGAGASPARAARTALEAGVSVVNFAEGTTTDGTRVGRFQVGLFRLARKLDVPVVPVHVGYQEPSMAWVGDATFLPHYARFAARPRTQAQLTFCPSIKPRSAQTAAELATTTRSAVAAVAGLALDGSPM